MKIIVGWTLGILLLALGPRWLRGADPQPPTIQMVSPAPGATVSNLTAVTVTFSEAIPIIEAEDLLVNGSPAVGLSGSSNVWTFAFGQPSPGAVQFSWDGAHAISDLAGDRFDETVPAAVWSNMLIDTIAPTVRAVFPTPGAALSALTLIEVTFSEPITGVDASDLLINGQPATAVTGGDAGPYLFSVTPPVDGTVNVAWAGAQNIRDTAPAPNPFLGGSWIYTLNSALTADVVLNEIMADNLNGLLDEDRDTSDWIELLNRGATSVNLLGWSLTDDPANPGQWVFPAITLNPGQYLLVFASGKNRATTGPLTNHTSFVLGGSEYLGLYNARLPRQVASAFAPSYPEQRGDISWGRTSSNTFAYFATATPRALNSSPTNYAGFAAQPHASVNSGLFGQAFNVVLSCETAGAAIYYTLNGDSPTPTNATLYTNPIMVSGSASKAVIPLRAAAYQAGLLPSSVLTRSYVFPDQVLFQPIRPAGFPTNWITGRGMATTSGDYEMDPQVLTNGSNAQIARQALAELPVVSLVASINTFFAPTTGVYTARLKQGNQRPVNAEMFLPSGQRVFQADCGFEIQGGSSPSDSGSDWKDKKLSLRLIFKGDFGTPKLQAKVFDDTPVDEFDTLQLDAGLNFWWTHMTDGDQRNRAKFITDQFTSDLMNNAGMVAQHGRHVHLFLNGLYWGLYDLHERMDEAAAASYLGGQKEQWDVLKHTGDTAGLQNGTLTNYTAMFQLARSGLANNATYERFQTFLDLPWFIDYMIVNLWVGNTDWANHNWYAWRRSRIPGSLPWRFISWDAEHTIKSYTENRLSVSEGNSPGELFQQLRNNREFRVLFGDHVHKLMFNGGPLYMVQGRPAFWSPTNTADNMPATAYRKRVDEIWNSVVCESARWGDVASTAINNPYTREVHYTRELNSLFTITNVSGQTPNYFPLRGSNVLAQFRTASLYPNVAAPAFSQHGGRVPAGYTLYITNIAGVGTAYYTTNGVDPRVYGSAAVSPQAVAYAGTPVSLGHTLTVKARTLNGTNWSALNEATFNVGSLGTPLRITELMYNPPGGDAHEFLELLNTSAADLDLGGYTFEGITFVFQPGFHFAAGARLVLASAADPAAFAAQYPGVVVSGYFGGTLANGGERIALRDPAGHIVLSVDYEDESGWPTAPDGRGYSLELIDPNGDPDAPANWRSSAQLKGTPGQSSTAPAAAAVVINEVMADNLSVLPNDATYPDWVELYNASAGEINLTGWSLSDDGNARKFVFTSGPTLPPGGYLLLWCDSNTNTTPGLHTGFALDRDGDNLFLYDPNTNRVDAVSFGLQLTDSTIGRVAGAWQLTQPTPQAANVAATLASPNNLVINEWLANAPPGGSDWIELYNRATDAPAELTGVYLGTGSDLSQVKALSFLAPAGFVQLFADELPGANHLDFKLPAAAGVIVLYDGAGLEINRVTYGAQAEGVSQGRLPNGDVNTVSFAGSSSPGASNYVAAYTGPTLNEVLAINHAAVTNSAGRTADFVELLNPSSTAFNLSGMRLSTDSAPSAQWFFPSGTLVPGNGQLVVWFDDERPASTLAGPVLNTGHALEGDSGAVYLLNAAGQVVDAVVYGLQVEDKSIGRTGGQWRLLQNPTPGAANATPATLGSATALRVNEWMADPVTGPDWFELFNGGADPVELSGLYLTDDPSIYGLAKFLIPPLSFIGAQGFAKFDADSDPSQGGNHVNFDLDLNGDTLRVYTAGLTLIDSVDFGLQQTGVSQGRLPDGAAGIVSFSTTSTPSESNYLPLPNAVVNEVLTHADPPLEDAIELFNPTAVPANVGGWFLSNNQKDFKKYRFPNGTTIPARGFLVIYENQFNSLNPATPFTLSSAQGDDVWLSASDTPGNLTGYRMTARFGAGQNAVSFGRFETSIGTDFTALSSRTFGMDTPASVEQFRTGTGLSNTYPRVGPLVLSEIMYHPPGTDGTNDNILDEFIEVSNVSGGPADFFDPAHTTNHWRLQGGVSFAFPASLTLSAGASLLVVNFDPVIAPGLLAAFRARYGITPSVPIYGPYGGKLDNGGEAVELAKPDSPEEGFVPYILADRVVYSDTAPWPTGADGNSNGAGASLQRRVSSAYGNEPLNWLAGTPTPGTTNTSVLLTLPTISQQPASQGTSVGSPVMFQVTASGGSPLLYQWRFNGANLRDATNATLTLADVQLSDEGNYSVFVSNPAGSVLSSVAVLTVGGAPAITQQPQSQGASPGATVIFTVAATGGGLTYQWRFNGASLLGQTNAVLTLNNVQVANVGPYSVLVSNTFGVATSANGYLAMTGPTITGQPQSQTNYAGTTGMFSVTASGDAPLSYQWRRNGVSLAGGTNGTLALPNLQPADSGSYNVVVANPVGSVTSLVATLTVIVPVQISQQPANRTAGAGSNVTFTVAATGTGTLRYQWRFNGVNVPNNPSASSASLMLTNVQLIHNGDYSVVVSDDISSITSSNATLTVLVRPMITVQPVSITVPLGSNATFYIEAAGTTPISFRWRRNNVLFNNAVFITTPSNSTLIVTNVQLTNDGNLFNVAVTNIAGTAPGFSSNAYLTVFGPPMITASPTNQTVNSGANVTLTVSVTGVAPLSYQWKFNDSDLLGQSDSTLSLLNVQAANEGYYAVMVSNRDGSATSQQALVTVLMPPVLSEPQVLGNGTFRMLLQGNINRSYFIEISSNLANWSTLSTLNYTNGRMPFLDATATNSAQRFYRARLVP